MLLYKLTIIFNLSLIFYNCCGSAQNNLPHYEHRLINGINTTIRYFPWQLSLRVRLSHVCGASVLTPTRALTAARCRLHGTPISAYTVLAGSTSRTGDLDSFVTEVDHFIIHPAYSRLTRANDIGVVWLKSSLQFNRRIRPIGFPQQNTAIPVGATGYVSGWGLRRWGISSSISPVLQYIAVPIRSSGYCRQSYPNSFLPSMFCAGSGNPSPCDGDFGSPLVVNGYQYGIVSWGELCGSRSHPYVYTRVSYYSDWLRSVI